MTTASALPPTARRPKNYARWRAGTLAGVYVLFALHIAHWKIAGKTLAPLELNEVMYTLELGIVTAGFLFMAVAALATLVFGRFFCSWGCHILALEDLCAWLLKKAGIRPKPVRSRALLIVPPAALFYMFVWPQISRVIAGRPAPSLRFLSDSEGWASFLTTDYWRNLPGPWVTAVTFLFCGFVIVYVLGTRAFCTYGCPYGTVFSALDRFAPGRIVGIGDCSDCGACTAACQSGVRVRDELVKHGMVVNPACLKDLDCVSACPDGRVRFGFMKPPGWRSFFGQRRIRLAWDFSPAEDALMAVVFVAVLTAYRGLYDTVPFLLSLALGGIAAYLAALAWRALIRKDVRWNDFQIKRQGRLTSTGTGFLALGALATGLTAHSGWIQVEDLLGTRALGRLESAVAHGAPPEKKVIDEARSHLLACRRFGFLVPVRLEAELARIDEVRGDLAGAAGGLRDVLGRRPGDFDTRLALGRVLLRAGKGGEAVDVLRAGLDAGPASPRDRKAFEGYSATAHLGIGEYLADQGRLEDAVDHLRQSLAIRPQSTEALYALGVLLSALGRDDDAIAQYEQAVLLQPKDPDLLNNLAYLLMERGRIEEAEPKLRAALEIAPDHAATHFNLGRLLQQRGKTEESARHLETAARLDQRFAAH